MAYERQQFKDSLEERKRQKVRESRTELRVLAQAQVPIESLTKSVEWDYFLSLLQAKIEELDIALNTYQQSQITDLDFSHQELAARKAIAMRFALQRDTLQAVLDLPKQILEIGEKARLELDRYDNE
jgi:hypothetical protein